MQHGGCAERCGTASCAPGECLPADATSRVLLDGARVDADQDAGMVTGGGGGLRVDNSNRRTARGEMRIIPTVEADGLRLRVERRYVYDRDNYRGEWIDKVVTLKTLHWLVLWEQRETWGEVWSWLLDAVLVMQQARAHSISIILLPGLTGEAQVLYECLARTVAYEVNCAVMIEGAETGDQQLALFEAIAAI